MKIALLGGTGFVGKSLADFVLSHHSDVDLTLYSRTPRVTSGQPFLEFLEKNKTGQVQLRAAESLGDDLKSAKYTHLIHGAVSSDERVYRDEKVSLDVVNSDLSSLLMRVSTLQTPPKFIYLSSGAVYGSFQDATHPDEDALYGEFPAGPKQLYSMLKQDAERKVQAAHRLTSVILRLFAFIGPWLPTEQHFLAGQTIRALETNLPLELKARAFVTRSYLYADDMAKQILAICKQSQHSVYNVGASKSYELAEYCNELGDTLGLRSTLHTARDETPDYYVPNVNRLETEFELVSESSITSSMNKTLQARKIRGLYNAY